MFEGELTMIRFSASSFAIAFLVSTVFAQAQTQPAQPTTLAAMVDRQISGVEQASVPIITAILMTAKSVGIDLHAFTVRKERKAFGLENYIEGTPNPQLPAVFIDDLTSPNHATLWHWIRIVTQARLRFYPRSFVVIYKGNRAELKDIPTTRGNLGIDAIYTLEDFDMTWEHYHGNKFKTGPNV